MARRADPTFHYRNRGVTRVLADNRDTLPKDDRRARLALPSLPHLAKQKRTAGMPRLSQGPPPLSQGPPHFHGLPLPPVLV
jgi:hypothetical protein